LQIAEDDAAVVRIGIGDERHEAADALRVDTLRAGEVKNQPGAGIGDKRMQLVAKGVARRIIEGAGGETSICIGTPMTALFRTGTGYSSSIKSRSEIMVKPFDFSVS
jgi:hypothetical protein